MQISGKTYHTFETTPADIARRKPTLELVENNALVHKKPTRDSRRNGLGAHPAKELGFFRRIIFALPISIALWGVAICGIRFLLIQ